jgi:hypothetical protein
MRRSAFLAFFLLLTACAYEVSESSVTLRVGQRKSISIQALHWFSGSMYPVSATYVADDPTVVALRQTGGPSMELQGLRPGVTHISPDGSTTPLVGVMVLPCLPVTIVPAMAQILAMVGQKVELRVTTVGEQPAGTYWYEASGNEWRPIAFAGGNSYTFTAASSGTYRYRAEYVDLCGTVTADFTVVVSTRPRAVRR